MKAWFLPLLGIASFSLLGGDEQAFTLKSPSFQDGGALPAKYAMKKITGGENVSPALSWNNAPAGTKSFALTCVDVHPVARNWVHWMVTGIPASGSSLGEGASGAEMPKASVELKNSFGFAGWGGPQPPPGSGKHKYVFTIYALSVETVQLGQAPVPEEKFIDALNGKVLAKAAISGTFERK